MAEQRKLSEEHSRFVLKHLFINASWVKLKSLQLPCNHEIESVPSVALFDNCLLGAEGLAL